MSKVIKFNVKLLVDGKEQLVTATGNAKELGRSLAEANKSAQKMSSGFSRWGFGAMALSSLTTSISALTSAMHGLLDESNKFNSAMRAANTMAGKSSAEFKQLKNQVAELAETIPIARDALAKGLYQVISNGVPEDNWITFLEASAKSSVGGIADLEEVVKVTSTIIKNYGMEWSDAQAIQDKIQLTAKNGVTSFEQLAAALPSVTGQAAQLGVSLDEMLAVMATLTGVTGNTSEVSTQLASVLTALTKESAKSQKMAEAMGISFNAAGVRAAGGLKYFIQDLDKAVTAYASKSGMLKESIYSKLFGRAEALRLVNSLTGELSEKFTENIELMKDSAGTMGDAYNDMASTGEAKTQLFMNKISALTDSVAEFAAKWNLVPFLDVMANVGMMVMGFTSLARVINLSRVAHLAHAASAKMAALSQKLFTIATNLSKESAIAAALGLNVQAAGFRAVSIAARIAAVAVRSFLAATGIGIALVAVGYALQAVTEYFMDSGEAAEDAADKFDIAADSAQRVHDAFANEESRVFSDLMTKFAQLQGAWKSLSSAASKAAWIKQHARDFEELGIKVNNAADAEYFFVRNTDAVVESIKRRAQAAARLAQLTEEYRLQMELTDKIAEEQARLDEKHQAKAGAPVTYEQSAYLGGGYSTDKGMYNDPHDGKWHWTDEGAAAYNRKYGHWESSTQKQLKAEKDKSVARSNKLASEIAADKKGTPAYSRPTAPTSTGGKDDKDKKDTEKHLIANAKSYKDLANNVAYYQQELEKLSITDKDKIKELAKKKAEAQKAMDAFNDKVAEASMIDNPKTLADYDKNLEALRKTRERATAEEIAGIDKKIAAQEKAKKALEDKTIADLQISEIKNYKQLNDKLAYYNRQLDGADEAQRKTIQNGIKQLEKLKQAWDEALRSLPETTDTLADIDEAIQFYTDRQQREDAAQIQKTQELIDALQRKRSSLELATTIGGMKDELAAITGSSGRRRRQKIGDLGIDGLTSKIKELQDLLDNPKQMFTSDQRQQVEDMIASYKKLRKEAARSFDTFKDGYGAIKGVGSAVESVTDALEGDKNAWQVVTSLVDAFIQMYEGISKIVEIVKLLTGATQANAAAKQSEAVATTVGTAATAADIGVTTADTEAHLTNTAAKSGEAIAGATSSGASMPFPYNLIAIAAGVAAVLAALATIGKFASGGIVGGNSPVGDRLFARVNSGEMILNKRQQNRLWSFINDTQTMGNLRPHANMGGVQGAMLSLDWKLKGKDLVAVLANETRVSSKSGRRTNIKV